MPKGATRKRKTIAISHLQLLLSLFVMTLWTNVQTSTNEQAVKMYCNQILLVFWLDSVYVFSLDYFVSTIQQHRSYQQHKTLKKIKDQIYATRAKKAAQRLVGPSSGSSRGAARYTNTVCKMMENLFGLTYERGVSPHSSANQINV